MKKIFTVCLLSVFLLNFLTTPVFSQTAKEILAKMINAQGGKKVLESIKDTTLSGSLEMVAMGLSGSITMYQKEPNKLRMDIEVMGMIITQAYDGEKAWGVDPQTGSTQEMSEREATDFKRQALGNDAFLHPEKYGITYAYKGVEKIEGKDYLVLEQTYSDGYKATSYVDPDTYLTYKTKATSVNQMGVEVEAETIISDYKKVEGIMVPHSIIVFQDGEEFITIAFTEVKFNSDIEDSLFKMSE